MSRLPDLSSRPRRGAGSALDVGLVMVGALALAWTAGEAWAARRALAPARAAVERLRQETAGPADPGRPPPSLASRDAEIVALALTLEAPPPGVLGELARLLPDDVRFERTALAYGDTLRVKLDVVARDAFAYDRFLERLLRSQRFVAVTPGVEARGGTVRSSVSVEFVPELRP